VRKLYHDGEHHFQQVAVSPSVAGHLYVTRNATLEYQHLTRQRFEEARCELTVRLLSAPESLAEPGAYLVLPQTAAVPPLRAWTRVDGPLRVVTKIEAL
jgi:hypothetical protein